MNFEIKPVQLPPIVWNFEEIKAELKAEMKKYQALVYTDDNIKEAKQDRALLNKVIKELNDKKLVVKRNYCAPYEAFENQVKELQAIVSNTNANIDAAVKGYEERKRAEKTEEIKAAYHEIFAELADDVPLEMVWQPYWLNASIPMKQVTDALKIRAIDIRNDLSYIDKLEPNKRLAVRFDYLKTLRLTDALNLNRERQDFEKKNTPQTAEKSADSYEITLRIVVTDEKLDDLLVYLNEKGIELIL